MGGKAAMGRCAGGMDGRKGGKGGDEDPADDSCESPISYSEMSPISQARHQKDDQIRFNVLLFFKLMREPTITGDFDSLDTVDDIINFLCTKLTGGVKPAQLRLLFGRKDLSDFRNSTIEELHLQSGSSIQVLVKQAEEGM